MYDTLKAMGCEGVNWIGRAAVKNNAVGGGGGIFG